ncbi:MAG: hypothetical protein P1V20_12350 [Verrucomicrobiales bacterium]|nr:hypothetical protein [Verrucomicrobiales bacterium]
MTATSNPANVQTPVANNRLEALQPGNRIISPEISAEEKLTKRILRDGNGKGLMKFCRELSVILIRRYSIDDDAADLREALVPSLQNTLNCSEQQAHCLIDLALEMIHAKVHGKYRRTDVELGGLIAVATGAVTDVAAN